MLPGPLTEENGPPGGPSAGVAGGDDPTLELLLFAVGGEWHSLPVEQVAGVEPQGPIATVPGAAPAVLGVFLWHGEVVPALDPAPALIGRDGVATGGFLVIGRGEAGPVGLLADAVEAVVSVDPAAVEPPLPTLDAPRAALVRGQVQAEDHWVTVVALDPLVAALTERPDDRR